MAKGDLIQAQVPPAEIYYSKRKTADTSQAGDPVAFEKTGAETGSFSKAINTTVGPIKILLGMKNTNNGSEAWLMSGLVECVAGGAIVPGTVVKVASSSKLIASATKAIQDVGVYVRKVSDAPGNPTAAALDDRIIVRVTA